MRSVFCWKEQAYRVDSTTPLFWPNARIIIETGDSMHVRLCAVSSALATFAFQGGPPEDLDDSSSVVMAAAIERLESEGKTVLTVSDAIAAIVPSPDAVVAPLLLERLEYYFFIGKLPA